MHDGAAIWLQAARQPGDPHPGRAAWLAARMAAAGGEAGTAEALRLLAAARDAGYRPEGGLGAAREFAPLRALPAFRSAVGEAGK
jgi:hypothetical protein